VSGLLEVPDLPLPPPRRWLSAPEGWSAEGGALTISAGAGTDLFVDPGGADPVLNAPCLLASPPPGDFWLSARVRADFAATYDAGALVVYSRERAWAKLAFEYSPQGRPTIVSVVTRGVSDDCNSFEVAGGHVWLRVARVEPAFAFHASTDGTWWHMVRYFALEIPRTLEVGFLAQSPTGQGCAAWFDQIGYSPVRLSDLRGGA
jgi:uncharacterized protein